MMSEKTHFGGRNEEGKAVRSAPTRSQIELPRQFIELGIGRRDLAASPGVGARQREIVYCEEVCKPRERMRLDVAEQRPQVRGIAAPVCNVSRKSS
jgi:hypothetical protein